MKKACLLALVLLSACALCACGYSSLERQTFAICMSVDRLEDGQIKLGLQAPKSGQSAEGGLTADYEVITATGDSPKEALRLLAATTPYPINFCQLRLVLLRYELAASAELRSLLRFLQELPTMRPNATVMVALGDAQAVMEAQTPEFGMRLSTHLNILLQRLQAQALLPMSTLSHCVQLIGSGYGDPLLCVCAVNPTLEQQQKKEQESDKGSSGGSSQPAYAEGEPWNESLLPEDLLAGMLPRTSGNPVEYLGSATVSDGRVSGLLSASETQLVLRALNEAVKRVAISPSGVQLQLLLDKDSVLDADRDKLGQAVKIVQALDCDALCFGEAALSAFVTDADWDAFAFHRQYKQAELAIGVK